MNQIMFNLNLFLKARSSILQKTAGIVEYQVKILQMIVFYTRKTKQKQTVAKIETGGQ